MIQLPRFAEFVNEAKHRGKLKLLVISDHKSKELNTPDFLVNQAKSVGMEAYLLKLDGAKIEDSPKDNGNFLVKNVNDSKGFIINKNNTIVISRRGIVKNTYTRSIQSLLEKNGFFCINPLNSIEISENKFITGEKLERANLPVPKTALVPNENALDSALDKIGGNFPIIVKTLSGTQGIGVSVVDSYESLKSVLQTFWKLSNTEILIQEKIESDHDIRIQVLVKKFDGDLDKDSDDVIVLGQMRRNKIEKDFRTNHSLGGSVEKVKITDEQKNLAIKAAKAIGCYWCGVDIIVDKKTGNNYILEVNASPGTKGIEKVIGGSITNQIIDFISDKNNWASPVLEVGFREVIHVNDIGDFVAKFDSGNGAKSSTIHADKINIDGDTVKWEINDKKFTNKIIGYSNAEIGEETYERPIIGIDIKFNGKTYTDVHFSLADRTVKSTPMLINRKTMKILGVIVNPQKTFMLRNFKEDYNPTKSKNKRYSGILFK